MTRKLIVTLVLVAFICSCSQAPAPPSRSLNAVASQGNLEAVRQHIEAGSDLDDGSEDGGSPLITASTFGHVEVARALIEAGADVNQRNTEGSTALHTAAFLCRTEIVEILLDHGAQKDVRSNIGATALDSVAGSFEEVKGIYEYLESILGPVGLKLDYERIKATRPTIAAMLR